MPSIKGVSFVEAGVVVYDVFVVLGKLLYFVISSNGIMFI